MGNSLGCIFRIVVQLTNAISASVIAHSTIDDAVGFTSVNAAEATTTANTSTQTNIYRMQEHAPCYDYPING